MRMDEFNVRMKKRGVERVNEVLAERRTDEAIRETAWAKIRSYRRWALFLFCFGIIYFAASLLLKEPVNVFIFLLIYGLSLCAFIRSLVTRYRLSRGYYSTTDDEVREIVAHVLSRKSR